MKLPLSLIKAFLPLELSPTQIGETLTLLGIEVDAIENEQPPFAGVVVGEVMSAQRHPDAKNLQIAEVSDGNQIFSVVCGAPNCRAGMKTAFAQCGAVLKEKRIEKTTIRGVQSHGMLCSAAELNLSSHSEGILELPFEMKTGEDLIQVLWDPIFELSLTPNLGHCMSALGIARELSAALQIPLHRTAPSLPQTPLNIKVHVQDERLCKRYMCRLVENVKVGPSPFWLKHQLESCGQKSINNLVDAANYIMMKTGQPLHVFDFDLLEGDSLEIGPSSKSHSFMGLDGIEREVPAGSLFISDGKKPIALAGIMGGANSAVSETTTRVLVEAACFDPICIRNTSKKIALRSESSQRFEKGVDPVGVEAALNEACQMMEGAVKGFFDWKKGSLHPKKIAFRFSRANQLLGTHLSTTEIEQIFTRLGFKTVKEEVEVPLYRADINEEIDLIEEVARIYGYNHIAKPTPKVTLSQHPNDPMFLFENEMRRKMSGLGLCEFLTCDLISPKLAEIGHAITPLSMGFLKMAYSKSEEYSVLRTSLLPGLLQVVKGNLDQKNLSIAAFEIGRIHFMQKDKVVEIPMGAILLSGKASLPHWSQKSAEVDFFDLKGIVENLLNADFRPSQHITFHPGRQADVQIGELTVGSLGEVHPAFLEKFNIDQRVYYAELHLPYLMQFKKTHLRMNPLPQFPSSQRDWTIPLPPKLLIDQVFHAIHSVRSPLLEKVELIDLYQPEETMQKNATLRFTYRDKLKTISFEEVESEHAKMIEFVAKNLAK